MKKEIIDFVVSAVPFLIVKDDRRINKLNGPELIRVILIGIIITVGVGYVLENKLTKLEGKLEQYEALAQYRDAKTAQAIERLENTVFVKNAAP